MLIATPLALAFGTKTGAELYGPGVISTGDYELNAAFSPSGDTLLFTKSVFNHWHMTIFMAVREGDEWKSTVAPYSGIWSDVDAIYSPDGAEIYFISNRPTADRDTTADFNIWKTARSSAGWSDPELLPEPVNGPGDDYYPSLTNGGTIYFSSNREGGGRFDIYRAARMGQGFADAERLPASVNSARNEIDVFVDPNERFIVFASYGRQDSFGGGDLYVSFREGNGWSSAVNLGSCGVQCRRPFLTKGYDRIS